MQDLKPLPTLTVRAFYLKAEEDFQVPGEEGTDGPGLPPSSETQVRASRPSKVPLLGLRSQKNLDEGCLLNHGHFWMECGSFPQQMGLRG